MTGVAVHLIVPGAERASAWYRDVLGADERSRITLPDGRLIDVELTMSGSTFVLADEFPEQGAVRPPTGVTASVAFYLEFDDVDAVWRKAIAAGATEHRTLQDTPFGARDGQIVDPFGYRWGFSRHLRDMSHEEKSRAVAEMFG